MKFLVLLITFFTLSVSAEDTTSERRTPLRIEIGVPDVSISAHVKYKGYTNRCDKFVDSGGQLGVWGKALMRAIQKVGIDCFFNQVDYSVLCPNYKDLPNFRKIQFVAFIFGVLAYDESSCHANAQGQGPNGVADGLFQLEYSRDLRDGSDRDEHFCKTKQGVNTQDITFQMECTASIFRDGFCKRDNIPGKDFWYWEKLNGTGKVVTRNVQKFPFCRD